MNWLMMCSGLVILLGLGTLYTMTGFLQFDAIDVKDFAYWSFDDDGVISGAQGFVLNGTSGRCWVMVHGYSSTPDELRVVAEAVYATYQDTIYVPRLHGHGMVPSALEKFSVDGWYAQVTEIAQEHHCSYMLGSSMGASLALRYAEEHNMSGMVVVGLPFEFEPSFLPMKTVTRLLLPVIRYNKRQQPGQTVDDPVGRAAHITGFSFPLKGVVEVSEFNDRVIGDLYRVQSPVLFLHATRDTVASLGGAWLAYDSISSEKMFVELAGDHIVFRDYGKWRAVEEVLRFREK